MTEHHPAAGHQHEHGRAYLPGMGRHRLLRFYDPLSRLYGARTLHRRLLDQADLRPGQQVVEIGCGTGNLTVLVKRRQPDATVRGLDPDPEALARATGKARRAGLAVEFERGFADHLPYADGSVDRVLSALMVHHLDPADRPAALREVARVLAPGGSVHVVDFGGTSEPEGLLRRLLRRPHRHGGGGDELPALLRAAGLRDPRVTGHESTLLGPCTFYRADR